MFEKCPRLLSVANTWLILACIYVVLGYRTNYQRYKPENDTNSKYSSQHQTPEGRLLQNQKRRPPGQSRIVGGRLAVYGEANYQVFLYNFFDHTDCGGTLVELNGLRFVTTAAHCLWVGSKDGRHHAVGPEYLFVVGGTVNVRVWNPASVEFNVSRVEVHEKYDPRYHHNDIGILFLNKYAHKYEGLSTIPMARLDFDLPDWFTISGFGVRRTEGDEDGKLRVVELPHYPNEECMSLLPYLSPAQFCVANTDYQFPKGDCFGDSGGPIVGYNWTTLTWFQYGIVSAGAFWECGKPSYHTRVSKQWDWIYSKVQDQLFYCGSGHPTEDSPLRYPHCKYPYSDPCYRANSCKTDVSIFPNER